MLTGAVDSANGTTSDDKGDFDFGELPDGLYVLHIVKGEMKQFGEYYLDEDFLVTVDSYARNKSLSLRKDSTGSCGGLTLEQDKPAA